MKSIINTTLLLSLGLSTNTIASNSTGTINILGINRYDEVLVQTTDNDDYATCASSFKRYAADLNTDHGRSMFSLMLAAKAQSKPIYISGTGVCDVRNDAESIQYVEIID